jgi:hypothetical protein
MTRHRLNSQRLLLAALFVGLNVLCLMGAIHGRHVTRHTRVNYSHVSARGTTRAGSRSDSEHGTAVDVVAAHAVSAHFFAAPASERVISWSSAKAPAVILLGLLFHRNDQVELLLSRENVLALGSPPRAPGLGRAPPAV